MEHGRSVLKFFLIAGAILWGILFGAAMAEVYLGGALSASPQRTDLVPVGTVTPVPSAAPAPATVTTGIRTRTAGTLSPYSGDPDSITPDPDATEYVAPGYRSGEERMVVYVTPYPLETVTSITIDTSPTRTGPPSITTTPATTRPRTTTPAPAPPRAKPPNVNVPPPPVANRSPCNCAVDTYNCDDLLALTCYDYCMAEGKGDVHDLDRDNDGRPCEGTNTSSPRPPVPKEKNYTITVRVEGFGSVSPPGPVTVKAGEDVQFRLIRDPPKVAPSPTGGDNYTIHNVVQVDPTTMDLPPYQEPNREPEPFDLHRDSRLTTSYTFHDVQSDHTLRVVFYKLRVPQP